MTIISEDEEVRHAAQSCLEGAVVVRPAPPENGATPAPPPDRMHPACSVCAVLVSSAGGESSFSSQIGSFSPLWELMMRLKLQSGGEDETGRVEIRAVRRLDVGSQDAAAVQARIHEKVHGWLVLLKCRLVGEEANDSSARTWRCISAAFSSSNQKPVRPGDVQGVTQLVWDKYGAANRACDGARMLAEAFHATCRLTFVSNDEGSLVQIKDAAEFGDMVTHRYTASQSMHIPYAHLRDDPRVAARDSLLSMEFATNDCCLVRMKIGHPPCLWTDLLTCVRLGTEWWIVHKSSCHEPFLTEEAAAGTTVAEAPG